ncbi:hypothetical protein Tco_0024850 [Tanacetum coccineum]
MYLRNPSYDRPFVSPQAQSCGIYTRRTLTMHIFCGKTSFLRLRQKFSKEGSVRDGCINPRGHPQLRILQRYYAMAFEEQFPPREQREARIKQIQMQSLNEASTSPPRNRRAKELSVRKSGAEFYICKDSRIDAIKDSNTVSDGRDKVMTDVEDTHALIIDLEAFEDNFSEIQQTNQYADCALPPFPGHWNEKKNHQSTKSKRMSPKFSKNEKSIYKAALLPVNSWILMKRQDLVSTYGDNRSQSKTPRIWCMRIDQDPPLEHRPKGPEKNVREEDPAST